MAEAAALPQLDGGVFLTDGGAETDLIFHRGVELPEFASFVLHDSPETEVPVHDYFIDYLRIAGDAELGLILETLTWRASADWARVSATTLVVCTMRIGGRSSSCRSSATSTVPVRC